MGGQACVFYGAAQVSKDIAWNDWKGDVGGFGSNAKVSTRCRNLSMAQRCRSCYTIRR